MEPEQLRKLFVRNINFSTNEDKLKSHFEQYGKVTEVMIMKEAKTQRSRGFGFVTFSHSTQGVYSVLMDCQLDRKMIARSDTYITKCVCILHIYIYIFI